MSLSGLNWENQLCGVDPEVAARIPAYSLQRSVGEAVARKCSISAGQTVSVLVHQAR